MYLRQLNDQHWIIFPRLAMEVDENNSFGLSEATRLSCEGKGS